LPVYRPLDSSVAKGSLYFYGCYLQLAIWLRAASPPALEISLAYAFAFLHQKKMYTVFVGCLSV
jgi:hypothetical protein